MYPASPAPKDVDFESSFDSNVDRARSGRRYWSRNGGHLFKFTWNYTKQPQALIQPLLAFCHAQNGREKTFDVVVPLISHSLGDVSGSSPLVKTHTASGQSVPLSGLAALKTVCKEGDVIRFAGHSKVYLLTSDLISDNFGEATAEFSPPLVKAATVNEAVTIDAVPFQCALADDRMAVKLKHADRHPFSIRMEEAY